MRVKVKGIKSEHRGEVNEKGRGEENQCSTFNVQRSDALTKPPVNPIGDSQT